MARINIENEIFSDRRWIKLVLAVGSEETALGALVFLWITAQKYWKKDRARIPKAAWDEQQLNHALIETGWAEWDDEFSGFYASGSSNHFDWLLERKAAGKLGGETRASNFNKIRASKRKQTQANASKRKPLLYSTQSQTQKGGEEFFCDVETSPPPVLDEPDFEPRCVNPLVEIWNEHCGSMSKAAKLTPKRKKAAEKLWRENPSRDYWREVVVRMANSKFLTGDNDRNWRAGFDFLLRSETHVRVIEGAYDGKKVETTDDGMFRV